MKEDSGCCRIVGFYRIISRLVQCLGINNTVINIVIQNGVIKEWE